MTKNDAFPSRYLKAEELGGKARLLTMKDVTMETFDDGKTKPILHFENTDKILILNVTNFDLISKYAGLNTDSWRGKHVVLYPTPVRYKGELMDGIRCREPQGRQQPVARNPEPPTMTEALPPDDEAVGEDDVPF